MISTTYIVKNAGLNEGLDGLNIIKEVKVRSKRKRNKRLLKRYWYVMLIGFLFVFYLISKLFKR